MGRSRCMVVVVGGALMALAAGCYSAPEMSFDGNLHARGGELGDWDLDPDTCISSAEGHEKGVDVSSFYGDHCVRFYDDPDIGPSVIAYLPGTDDGRTFVPRDCAVFDVKLRRVVDQFDNVYNSGGSIELDCETEAGALFGSVAFTGCW